MFLLLFCRQHTKSARLASAWRQAWRPRGGGSTFGIADSMLQTPSVVARRAERSPYGSDVEGCCCCSCLWRGAGAKKGDVAIHPRGKGGIAAAFPGVVTTEPLPDAEAGGGSHREQLARKVHDLSISLVRRSGRSLTNISAAGPASTSVSPRGGAEASSAKGPNSSGPHPVSPPSTRPPALSPRARAAPPRQRVSIQMSPQRPRGLTMRKEDSEKRLDEVFDAIRRSLPELPVDGSMSDATASDDDGVVDPGVARSSLATDSTPSPSAKASQNLIYWWRVVCAAGVPEAHVSDEKRLRQTARIVRRVCAELGIQCESETKHDTAGFPVLADGARPKGPMLRALTDRLRRCFRAESAGSVTAEPQTLFWWGVLQRADVSPQRLSSDTEIARLARLLDRAVRHVGLRLASTPRRSSPQTKQERNALPFPRLERLPDAAERDEVVSCLRSLLSARAAPLVDVQL